jgi:hypothetical protein
MLLSIALFIWFASLVVLASFHHHSIGSESLAVWGRGDGAIFVHYRHPPSAAPRQRKLHPRSPELARASLMDDPQNWRSRWGIQRYSNRSPRGSIDAIYVSYPWLLAVSALPMVVGGVLHMRRPQRQIAGNCPNCGYDVRATPQRCPECGQAQRGATMIDHLLAFDLRWWRGWLKRTCRARRSDPLNSTTNPPEKTAER